MNPKQLRERWQPEQIATVEAQLLSASRTPNGVAFESPFGSTDAGRLDFRGVTLSRPVRHTRLRHADLSGATFIEGASIVESELEDCMLDGVDMRGVFVGRSFTRCSLRGARLQQARLVGVFTDCDFSRATLSGSVASGTRFERCTFTNARLGSILWTQRCVFDDCGFEELAALSGSLAGSVFIGSAPADTGRCITDHVSRVEAR